MEIVENIALISINATLLFQLVSFLLFLFILNRIMIGPLRNTIKERSVYLEQIEQEIASADQTYEELARQLRKEESIAKKTAFRMRDELEAEGQKSALELISSTKEKISAMRLQAQKETDAKIAVARQEIHNEIETLSDQMIAALLGRRSSV